MLGGCPPSVPPTAGFAASPRSGEAPLTVQFTDQSDPGSASITSRQWSFDDGGASSSRSPSHTYQNPGTYTVSLTVTTPVGSDTERKTGYISVTARPTAEFTASPRSSEAPLTVQFTDQSDPGSASITSRQWSFGDGATGPQRNPSYTYQNPGTYSVSLIVITSVGSDTDIKTN